MRLGREGQLTSGWLPDDARRRFAEELAAFEQSRSLYERMGKEAEATWERAHEAYERGAAYNRASRNALISTGVGMGFYLAWAVESVYRVTRAQATHSIGVRLELLGWDLTAAGIAFIVAGLVIGAIGVARGRLPTPNDEQPKP